MPRVVVGRRRGIAWLTVVGPVGEELERPRLQTREVPDAAATVTFSDGAISASRSSSLAADSGITGWISSAAMRTTSSVVYSTVANRS